MLQPFTGRTADALDYRCGIRKTKFGGSEAYTHTGFWGKQVAWLLDQKIAIAVIYSRRWTNKGQRHRFWRKLWLHGQIPPGNNSSYFSPCSFRSALTALSHFSLGVTGKFVNQKERNQQQKAKSLVEKAE